MEPETLPRPRPAPEGRRVRVGGEHRKTPAASHNDTTPTVATTMNTFHPGESSSHPFHEPAPLPSSIPKVNELGATSAPLKSAAFFLGAYCKEFNGGLEHTLYFYGTIPSQPNSLHQKCVVSFRGLYALQGGESRPGSLSEGGSTGNEMRH